MYSKQFRSIHKKIHVLKSLFNKVAGLVNIEKFRDFLDNTSGGYGKSKFVLD